MLLFAGNFSKDRRFLPTHWMCRCGVGREEEEHIKVTSCTLYQDILVKYSDLSEDNQLARFYAEVLDWRDKFDREEEERKKKQ